MGRPKKNQNIEDESDVLLEQSESLSSQTETFSKAIKIQNKNLQDVVISCLDGVEVKFDKDGIAEIEEERIASYLLSIPSYKKV